METALTSFSKLEQRLRFESINPKFDWFAQKTEKAEKVEAKKTKVAKTAKEKSYELPEIPDYERPVLEKPQEFDFGEHVARDKTKLERPATQVREEYYYFLLIFID